MSRVTALLLLALAAIGCGGDEASSSSSEPAAPAPAPPPAGLLLELGFGDGPRVLGALRAQVQSPLIDGMIPSSAGDLLARITDLPDEVAARIPADAVLRGVMVAGPAAPGWAYVVPVRTEDSEPHPLGVTIPVAAGAPGGGVWVNGPPTLEHPPTMLLGGLLVVATDTLTLDASLAYLRHRAHAAEAPRGFQLRAPAGVVAERGRPWADAELDALTRGALEGARAERARHPEAPAFGEPERLVAQLREPVARWVAFLPDLGEATLTIDVGPAGLEATLEGEVTPDSPLARELATLPTGEVFGLGALPEGTAVGWSRRGSAGRAFFDAVADVASGRLDAGDRATLEREHARLAAASSEGSLGAIGRSDGGPWALLAGKGEGTLDADGLRAALAVPYVATVLGALLGCRGAAAPAAWGAPVDGLRSARLCRAAASGPPPEVSLAEAAPAFAVALTRRAGDGAGAPEAASTTARGLAGTAAGTLGARPDVARALAALGAHVSMAAVLVPSELPATAAALLGAPAPSSAPPGSLLADPAPTFVAFGHEGSRARLAVRVTPRGLDRLVDLALVARGLGEGP